MADAAVLYTVRNAVATVTLNRPERGNSLSGDMVSRLLEVFELVEAAVDVHVVVLTGAGKYFCTGMDLGTANQAAVSERLDAKQGEPSTSSRPEFIDLLERIRTCSKPVIVKLNGPVLGGGLGLAFVADARLAHADVYASFQEVRRGLVPAIISAYIVPQLGPFLSRDLMLSGRRASAQRLYEAGVLSDAPLASPAALDAATQALADEFRASAPQAMATTKRLIDYVCAHEHADNLAETARVFAAMVRTREASYGMQCFRDKKAPDWLAWHAARRSKL